MTATLRITLTLSVLSLVALPLAGAEKADDGPVRFERRQLLLSPNEGCALADVDRDGQTDIIAGTHWFAAPDFAPRPIRTIREFDDDFLANNGDHPYDVNGDGWIDVISGEWMEDEIHWYENPGKERLEKGLRWKPHLFKKTRGENEAMFLRDLDGDGVPEIIVDCWVSDAPLVCWKLVRDDAGEPAIERVVLGPSGCGHGMALGDVNGDGRDDILVKVGWYECPASNPLATEWTLHRDWDRPHGSTPFLVVDLTDDGRNDLIWGNGHDFGLYWFEQGEPDADGKTTWTEHLIDNEYSQTHTLAWVDIDGNGEPELITGKRVRGHSGKDPGGHDPECLYYYEWHPERREFTRHEISPPGGGPGTGMQINTADLNGDGLVDVAVGGKSGTWLLLNQGR
jgi:hypothetical protein